MKINKVWEFQAKTSNIHHSQSEMVQCCTQLPCSIFSVLALERERTPMTFIAMVTRQDIHPSEAEAE